MSELGFGRFESLRVTHGQIESWADAKKVRSLRFGEKQDVRTFARDFELKEHVARFFESIRSLEHAEIRSSEIRHGLPWSMDVEETAGQGTTSTKFK
jgi:hypothetical protein